MDYQYQTACVTFIDILGFGSMVDDVYRDDPAAISRILDLFVLEQSIADYGTYDELLVSHKPTSVMHFSDSVVRIVDLPTDYTPLQEARIVELPESDSEAAIAITREIHALRKIQNRLATAVLGFEKPGFPGVFVRGGFTIGNISYDQQKAKVFGPAMNKAVSLEKDVAHNPRIVIDPDCISEFNDVFSMIVDSGVVVATDGIHYIDYFTPEQLRASYNSDLSLVFRRGTACEQLAKMKQVLDQRLITHANEDVRIIAKYQWAAERHNEAVAKTAVFYGLSNEDTNALIIHIP